VKPGIPSSLTNNHLFSVTCTVIDKFIASTNFRPTVIRRVHISRHFR
jgi:hypothetical protein